ncbi:MAG: peptidylprolyl isomerase [Cellvibrionaceae bacterium]
MKKIPFVKTSFLIALLSFSAIQLTQAEAIVLDRVAVIVDNDVVMESELNAQLSAIKNRLKAQGAESPPDEVLKAQVLEHLIVQQLQLQMAKRAGVNIEDAEINQAMTEMQQRNKVTPQQFIAQLQAEGLTVEDLREDLRRELTINRVQRGVLGNRLDVTEHDVDSFLNSKEGKFWTAPEYNLGHILIPLSNSASTEEVAAAKNKAEDLKQQLENGADFSRIATTYSAGQNALQGGSIGWRKPAQLPELFSVNLNGMKIGEISNPFRSGAGFHLLKIHEQRGGGSEQLIDQTKVRHILLQTSVILSDEEARKKLLEVRTNILNGADFGEMAKEHSKDPGSMLAGGDLGWSTPGMFVPQFEQVMAVTEIGDISFPFQTQHGWHILHVEDRRKEDMSDRVIKNQAFNLLRSRRFEEELPIWLQEIRDDAYVDIKLKDLELDRTSVN